MKPLALVAILALGGFGGFGGAAACGDPYDGETVPPDEAGADARTSSATDAIATDGPLSDAGSEVDGPAVDANCDRCDCDGDGYVLDDVARCPDARGKARDCDDLDSRANPGAGFRADEPTTTTAGDWDCSGSVTREISAVMIDCPSRPASSCAGVEGFATNPGCGESAPYITCVSMGGSCIAGSFAQKVQRCK